MDIQRRIQDGQADTVTGRQVREVRPQERTEPSGELAREEETRELISCDSVQLQLEIRRLVGA